MIADPHIEKLPDPHDVKRRVAEIVAEYEPFAGGELVLAQAMALRIAAVEHKLVLARAQLAPGEVSA